MELIKPELDVALVPSDPEVTCDYYRDVIGLSPEPSVTFASGARQDRFSLGKHRVKVNRAASPPARESGGVEVAVGMRLLALILDEARFDGIVARLDAAGRRHSALPVGDAPYRVRLTKDPDGTVIELVGLKAPAESRHTDRLQIGLTVSDVARSRQFYGQVLGLSEQPEVALGNGLGTRYAFTWGNTTIKFWRAPDEVPVRTGAPNSRAGLRTFTAVVPDIEAAHAELIAKGVPIALEPLELPGIARILFFADPDGNWIELSQRLS
jgi:catechol 2,3-dioxygenase-like lactoylglutathione lyase family enzyme